MSVDGDSDPEGSKSKADSWHSQEGSGESKGFTGYVKELSGESVTAPQTSEQINAEKLIESTFIFLLHTLCLELGNLDLTWSLNSPQPKVTLGEASTVATHDGQLKYSKLSVQPEAIVEASILLASDAYRVFMQMGIEMMIWMLIMGHVMDLPSIRIVANTLSCAASDILRLRFQPDVVVCNESGHSTLLLRNVFFNCHTVEATSRIPGMQMRPSVTKWLIGLELPRYTPERQCAPSSRLPASSSARIRSERQKMHMLPARPISPKSSAVYPLHQ